eukprot:1916556-Pyramimonas_sp.AAC.1
MGLVSSPTRTTARPARCLWDSIITVTSDQRAALVSQTDASSGMGCSISPRLTSTPSMASVCLDCCVDGGGVCLTQCSTSVSGSPSKRGAVVMHPTWFF